jgi:hypothetical protein
MEHLTPNDPLETGFIAGWFLAQGITGQPTLMQIQEAIGAFARFAAALGRTLSSPARDAIHAALPHGAVEPLSE